MTDICVLEESQFRAAHTLFRGTLHHGPAPDDLWKHVSESYEPGRTHGAFDDGEMIGTAQSFTSGLCVPGGAVVPMATISRVGVRTDFTRRGVLSALKREQFEDLRARGEVAATLRASESAIYGRFGYGVATRGRSVLVDRRRAVTHGSPTGHTRMIDAETATKIAPEIYRMTRAGMVVRWPGWWSTQFGMAAKDHNVVYAVHSGPDGDDGMVSYRVKRDEVKDSSTLIVEDMFAVNAAAWADLWRFLLRVDLVDFVEAWLRPLDEPIEWLLADARALKVTEISDETWLRLVDVPAMLAARSYREAPPVVLGVTDKFLPDNDGTYLVTPDSARRTDEPADIELDVDLLAVVYLGDTTFGQLAAAGRITGDKLDAADALFQVDESPWAGTFF